MPKFGLIGSGPNLARAGFWQGRPVRTRITELANALGEFGIWVRLHYVYPYPHVDELIPLMPEGKLMPSALSGHSFSTRQ